MLRSSEERRFVTANPRSAELSARAAAGHLLRGVPLDRKQRVAGGFPVFCEHAEGGHLVDVDGHRYVDLCLGDTGAMTGHSLAVTVQAVGHQARHGFTTMLPSAA